MAAVVCIDVCTLMMESFGSLSRSTLNLELFLPKVYYWSAFLATTARDAVGRQELTVSLVTHHPF